MWALGAFKRTWEDKSPNNWEFLARAALTLEGGGAAGLREEAAPAFTAVSNFGPPVAQPFPPRALTALDFDGCRRHG